MSLPGGSKPLFSLGLVADVQAADADDATRDGRRQFFREAFLLLERAVDFWNNYKPRLIGVLSLGDCVDGRVSAAVTAGDRATAVGIWKGLNVPVHHVIGNHCLKFCDRETLYADLNIDAPYSSHDLGRGWRLLVLDTMDLSIRGWPDSTPKHMEACMYYEEHAGPTRMKGYNGGLGEQQLAWLQEQLIQAEQESIRIIVASHHAFAPGACGETHRAWNGDAVAEMCVNSPAFALALAGHDHPGGGVIWNGKPFITLEGMVEASGGEEAAGNAYGVLRVFDDRIEIDGCGTAVTNRTFLL